MKDSLLARALVANGLFSALTGGILLMAPGWLGSQLGVDQVVLLRIVGIGLVAFGAVVLWQSARRNRRMPLVLAITLADLLWVAGTVVLIAVLGREFSASGLVALGATGVLVAGFAVAQLRGISAVYAAPDAGGYSHHVCLEVPTDADPRRVWRAIRDLGRIADYAPGLVSSRLRGGGDAGVGAIRVCQAKNAEWAERCVDLDDAGRRVELEFLTGEPGFPFPFTRMRGGWEVPDDGDGGRVRVWWDVTPTHRWLAAVILPIMEHRAAGDMSRTVEAMASAGDAVTRTGVSRSRRTRRTAAAC